MSEEIAHSPVGASSMDRWENCPGSIRLCKGLVSVSSPFALEGTKAHEVGALYLTAGIWPKEVDPEMLEAVSVYTDFVEAEWQKAATSKDSFLLIEHRFHLKTIHPDLFGTADCVIYDANTRILKSIDYKHGAGISVEAEGNSQLRYYALGALLSSKAKARTVEQIIVQPRCYHELGPIRSETYEAIDLIDFSARLLEAVLRTEDPKAPLNPGDHCRFCPASGTCPAIHGKALALAKEEFSPTLSYNPQKLADTLAQLDAVESWAKSVRDFAYQEAIHGRTPPGFKLVDKRATRRWKEGSDIPSSLVESLDLSQDQLFDEPKLKSPAQIEKIIGKSKSARMTLAEFTESVSSGTVLVPESDKRSPALSAPETEFTIITKTQND